MSFELDEELADVQRLIFWRPSPDAELFLDCAAFRIESRIGFTPRTLIWLSAA